MQYGQCRKKQSRWLDDLYIMHARILVSSWWHDELRNFFFFSFTVHHHSFHQVIVIMLLLLLPFSFSSSPLTVWSSSSVSSADIINLDQKVENLLITDWKFVECNMNHDVVLLNQVSSSPDCSCFFSFVDAGIFPGGGGEEHYDDDKTEKDS